MHIRSVGSLLLFVVVFTACHHSSKEGQQKDAAGTQTSSTNGNQEKTPTIDTVYGDYRLGATTRGNAGMRNLLIITGTKSDTTKLDTTLEKDVKGRLKGMMVGDLNGNGRPEIYLFMLSEGSGEYGKIYAYEVNREGDKVIKISTNAIDTMERDAYRGRDTFYIRDQHLVRAFPVYKEGAPDALTTEKRGIIIYNLRTVGDTLTLEAAGN
jgi:hypothetical protein